MIIVQKKKEEQDLFRKKLKKILSLDPTISLTTNEQKYIFKTMQA